MIELLGAVLFLVLLYLWMRGWWFAGVLMGIVMAVGGGLYANGHGLAPSIAVVVGFLVALLPWVWLRVWRKPAQPHY